MTSRDRPDEPEAEPTSVQPAARPAPRWRAHLGPGLSVLGLVLLALALRLAFLRADPPNPLPNGFDSYELFAEPIAKAHEARSRALFGAWHTNPADDYQFWRVQSPAWVYPLWLWFAAFGVNHASLRAFSSVVSALGLGAALVFALRRRQATQTGADAPGLKGGPDFVCAAVAGLLVALNFYDILYQRSGLIEVAVGAWLAVMVLALDLARRDGRWLLLATAALALGFLSKQTMILAAPMYFVFALVAYIPWARRAELPRWVRALPPTFGVALAVGLAAYCSRPAYLRTVTHNVGHVMHDKSFSTLDDVPTVESGAVFGRILDFEQWQLGFFALLPVTAVLALVQVARWLGAIAWRAAARARGRSLPTLDDGYTSLAAAWLLTSLGSYATAQTALRFRMLAIVPAALLAGALVADAARWVAARPWLGRPFVRRVAAGALVLVAVGLGTAEHARAYSRWVATRTYDVRTVNTRIARITRRTDRPVVVGSWAPPFAFDTRAQFYYVRRPFNDTREQLSKLGITHVILMSRRDFSGTILRRAFPQLQRKLQARWSVQYRKRRVTVHAVAEPPLR